MEFRKFDYKRFKKTGSKKLNLLNFKQRKILLRKSKDTI